MVLSIVTSCYNHGKFLDEMISSVVNYNWSFEYEHIIINDGSTDAYTIEKLNEIEKNKLAIVIHQQNMGLAKARNAALRISKGKYILPLDSDNKIRPAVFEKAINLMNGDNSIAVVYTDAQYFGDKTHKWEVGSVEVSELLLVNKIDACALIRKAVLDELGYYDEKMPAMGSEDWELWLRFILNDKRLFYLPEIGFDYRVSNNSMMATETIPKYELTKAYVAGKYAKAYFEYCVELFEERKHLTKPPGRIIVKLLIRKIFSKMGLMKQDHQNN